MIVLPDEAAPDGKDWLPSSGADFRADAEALVKCKEEWAISFPGARSTNVSKLGWANKINDEFSMNFIFDTSLTSNPGKVLRTVMKEGVPEQVEFELVVLERNLEKLGVTKIGDSELSFDTEGDASGNTGNKASNTANADDTSNTKLCVPARKVVPKSAKVTLLRNSQSRLVSRNAVKFAIQHLRAK